MDMFNRIDRLVTKGRLLFSGIEPVGCGMKSDKNTSTAWLVMVSALSIGVVAALLIAFAFLPFDKSVPPSLMATLARDFSQMKKHNVTGTYTSHITAYTKAPILSDFRRQNLAATVRQGSVVLTLPNGSMAAHFLLLCRTKYDCQVSGANNLNNNVRITVTPHSVSQASRASAK